MEINNGREGHQHEGSSQWLVRYLNRQGDWLEKTRGNLMVTATVIAAMSFQAMVNPPGGVWQSDKCASDNRTETCKGEAGTAVLEYKNSKRIAYIGMEPGDNGDPRNIYGDGGSLYIGGVLFGRCAGSIR
ncbi:unnamed protein product [Arabidopsis arenosa]|uniref:PGG domain-containing protein n=1 Tax=Arabidopsis arenosa TaxID=38785 RepID=A0A8S2A3B8_ARAAE|nr:unnamed protein product [Arabidopsis arenosa]